MREQSSSLPHRLPGFLRSHLQWDTAAFLLIAVAVLFVRFLHPSLLLGYYQDDFFYYLKVAENIAAHGRSTFNGLYLTNGYHPLWMLVLVVLCFLFHGTAFFVALQAVSLAAALATFLLLRRIFQKCCKHAWANVFAFALGLASLQLMRYGMEVTLTLPLASWFIWRIVRPNASYLPGAIIKLGLIASCTVLSRLDAAILIVLCCIFLLPEVLRKRDPVWIALSFALGFVPLLVVYVLIQHHVFHLLTPVSGLAKQMKTGFMPSVETWQSLIPGDRFKFLNILPELLLLVSGLIACLLGVITRTCQQKENGNVHPIACALVLFPVAHWLALSILSDWYLWAWYFYSLTLGCIGALVLLATSRVQRAAQYSVLLYLFILIGYCAGYVVSKPNSIAILESSSALAHFMDSHPGVWMMGDQAGTTGYLSHQPIIQTEGLVMDRDFLMAMRQGTPLRTIVQRYHARYYAFFGEPDPDGCFRRREPTNAGPTSAHMDGIACTKPLATFYRMGIPIQVIDASTIR